MLASIFNKDILLWNSSKFSENSEPGSMELNDSIINSPNREQTKTFTPGLNDDIFRKSINEETIIECF